MHSAVCGMRVLRFSRAELLVQPSVRQAAAGPPLELQLAASAWLWGQPPEARPWVQREASAQLSAVPMERAEEARPSEAPVAAPLAEQAVLPLVERAEQPSAAPEGRPLAARVAQGERPAAELSALPEDERLSAAPSELPSSVQVALPAQQSSAAYRRMQALATAWLPKSRWLRAVSI